MPRNADIGCTFLARLNEETDWHWYIIIGKNPASADEILLLVHFTDINNKRKNWWEVIVDEHEFEGVLSKKSSINFDDACAVKRSVVDAVLSLANRIEQCPTEILEKICSAALKKNSSLKEKYKSWLPPEYI